MKTTLFYTILASTLLFTACSNNEVTRKDCLTQGMDYKKIMKLNYRTGEHEKVSMCVKKG